MWMKISRLNPAWVSVCYKAVALMTDWLRQHQDNPYPNDDEKESLIASTRLTMNQINYWFTNARRRILPKWILQRQIEEQDRKVHSKSPSQSTGRQPHEDIIVLWQYRLTDSAYPVYCLRFRPPWQPLLATCRLWPMSIVQYITWIFICVWWQYTVGHKNLQVLFSG